MLGPSDGSLKDDQLMAQGHVLEGGRRRSVDKSPGKGPETEHEEHRHSLAGEIVRAASLSGERRVKDLYVPKFSPGKPIGFIDRDRSLAED
jgi:hypothetical protein